MTGTENTEFECIKRYIGVSVTHKCAIRSDYKQGLNDKE